MGFGFWGGGILELFFIQSILNMHKSGGTIPFYHSPRMGETGGNGGEIKGVWHEAMVLVCLPLAAPIGLSALHIPTLCGCERGLVVPAEPLDDMSCLTTPGSAVPEMGCCLCP